MIAILGIGVFAASCNMSSKNAALQAQQNTIDSMKMEMAKQQVIDSMNEMVMLNTMMTIPAQEIAPVAHKPRTKIIYKYAAAKEPVSAQPVNTVNSNDNINTQPTTQTPPIVYQEPAQQPQKKGWSSKAKGAVIGGVAGAAAGAIINKRQRVVGGVVGSVLGAGAGLGIGAILDKKNGR